MRTGAGASSADQPRPSDSNRVLRRNGSSPCGALPTLDICRSGDHRVLAERGWAWGTNELTSYPQPTEGEQLSKPKGPLDVPTFISERKLLPRDWLIVDPFLSRRMTPTHTMMALETRRQLFAGLID